MALREAPDEGERIEKARRKALAWLLAHARVKRSHGREIYGVWAWGYGLKALARCLREPRPGDDKEAIRRVAGELVKALQIYQTVDGGWGYFDFRYRTFHPGGPSMSFVTGTNLLALYEARQAGVHVPEPIVRRAIRSLRRCRTPDGQYLYSFSHLYYPNAKINRRGGSLTRNPCCDLALHVFDAGVDEAQMVKGLENLLAMKQYARMALHRPWPHESWFAVSGYFYLYGYYYAGEVCRTLGAKDTARFAAGLVEEVLYTRQKDGSFWDYPFYGYDKPYGTAYGVMALLNLVPKKD
jgi:hypothetical protein